MHSAERYIGLIVACFFLPCLTPAQTPAKDGSSSTVAINLKGGEEPRPSRYSQADLPLAFEPNRGQAGHDISYVVRRGVLTAELLRNGIDLTLPGAKGISRQVGIRFIGSSPNPAIVPGAQLMGHTNYLLG